MANIKPNKDFTNGRFTKHPFNNAYQRSCCDCKKLKLIFEFYKSRRKGCGGYSYRCITCSIESSKIYCKNNKAKRRIHAIVAYKNNILSRRYEGIKLRSIQNGWPFIITKEEFMDWCNRVEKKCNYCDLIDLSLNKRGNTQLYMFTIDRKDNNMPYTIENICLACWTCNKTKAEIFGHDEFKELAQRYIKPKWQRKLETQANGNI